MKLKDAKELIDECKDKDGMLVEAELESLIVWAYDKGWTEGIEDYREEKDPTEEQEFYRTR
jgi:hypothetical protein